MNNGLSVERLKEILRYDPDTGIFVWRIALSPRKNVGDIAGCVNNRTRYRQIRIDRRTYMEHRLAFYYMEHRWPKDQTDHINHIRHDNRWLNLREATNRDNHRNRGMSRLNTSGVTGVYRQDGSWRAAIEFDNKNINLGSFRNIEDAALARREANIKYGFHKNHGKEMA